MADPSKKGSIATDQAAGAAEDLGKGQVNDVVLDTVVATEVYSQADYNRVLRKIDLWLLPLMWLCYGTQQADKVSIATQATFGLREDTGLVGQQFSCVYAPQPGPRMELITLRAHDDLLPGLPRRRRPRKLHHAKTQYQQNTLHLHVLLGGHRSLRGIRQQLRRTYGSSRPPRTL